MWALDVDTIEMEKNQKAAGRKGFGPDIFNHKAFKLCKY